MSTEDSTNIPYGYCQCGCGKKTNLMTENRPSRAEKKGEPRKFLKGHHGPNKGRKFKLGPRYFVEDRGYKTPCWIWQLYTDKDGYGKMGRWRAHRIYYAKRYGPIPKGMQLDHLCRVTSCVRPDHLEPVTSFENVRRGNIPKLSVAKAQEIRRLYASGEFTKRELSRRYEVGQGTIHCVIIHKTWHL